MKKHFIIFLIGILCLFLNTSQAFGITNAGREKRDPKAMNFWEFRGFFVFLTDDLNNYDADDQNRDDSFRNQPFIKINPGTNFTLGWTLRMKKITGDGSLNNNIPDPEKIAYKIRYGCGYSPAQVYRQTSQPLIVKHSTQNVLFPIDENTVSDFFKVPFKLTAGAKDCFCKIWIEAKELDSFGQYSDKMPVLAAANSRPIQVCSNPPVGSYPPVIEVMPAGYITEKDAWDFQFIIRDMGNDPKVEIKRYIISPEAARNLQFYGSFGEFEKTYYQGKIPHVSIYPPSGGRWPFYHVGYYLTSAGFRFEYPYCYFFELINSVQSVRGSTYCGFPNASARGGAIQRAIVKPAIDIQKINSAPVKKVAIKAYVRNLGNGEKVLATHQVIKTQADCDNIFEEEWSKFKSTPKVFSAPGEYPINWDFGAKDKGSRYCYRFVAANEGAKAIAGPFSFIVQDTEEKDLLLVLPPDNTQLTDTSAVLSADVFKPEQIKSVYFSVWRTDKKGEFASPDIVKNISKNFVSYKISDLVPGGNYEYNAKGTDINRHEFWTATSEKFTTKPGKPVIVLDKSDVGVKTNDASFSGHIEEFGGNPKVKIKVFLYPAETSPSGLWECDSRDGQVGNSGNVFDLGWRIPNGKTTNDSAKFSYSLSGLSMSGVDRPYCFYFGATGSIANKSSYTEPTLTQKYVVAPKCTKPDIVRKPQSFEISTRPNYSGNLNSDPMKVYFKWVVYDDAGKPIKNGFKATAIPDQEFKIGQTATSSLALSEIGKENAGKKVCIYAMAKNLMTESASAIGKENETCAIFPKLPEIENLRAIMRPNGEGTFYGKVKSLGSGYSGRAYFNIRPLNINESTSTWPISDYLTINGFSLGQEYSSLFRQREYMMNTRYCNMLLKTGGRQEYDRVCSAQSIKEGLDLVVQFCVKSDCLVKDNFECQGCSPARVYHSNTDVPVYSQLRIDKDKYNSFNERMGYHSCSRYLSGAWPCVGTGGTSGGCGDLALDMAVMYFYKNNKNIAKLFDSQYNAILNDGNNMSVVVDFQSGAIKYQVPRNRIFTYNYKIDGEYPNLFNSTCASYSSEKCDDSDDPKSTNFAPTPFRFFRWLHYNGSWRYEVGDWQLETVKNYNRVHIAETLKKIGLLMTIHPYMNGEQMASELNKGNLVVFRCDTTNGSHYRTAYKAENGYIHFKDPANNHYGSFPYSSFGSWCGTPSGNMEQYIIQPLPEKSP